MKKYLFSLAAVLCCAIAISVFTSCSKDDDASEFGEYYAQTVGDNLYGEMVCQQMDQALKTAFGNQQFYKRDDAKAIRTCDEVAKKVKDESIVGSINLMMRIGSTSTSASNTKVIKTYSFPLK